MSSSTRLLVHLVLLTALFFPGLTGAATAPSAPERRILQLQKKYQQLHSLEFDFAQTTMTGGRLKQGVGRAVFYRPNATSREPVAGKGVLRWDYTSPVTQTIVNDGTTLSIYTPQDKQLIVSPAREMEADLTYALFTGTRSLLDEFVAVPADGQFTLNEPPVKTEAILLTPRRPHPQIQRVQLWFSSDLSLQRLLMEDHFGSQTELTFSSVRFNTLPPGDSHKLRALLHLDVPPDTEIIKQ